MLREVLFAKIHQAVVTHSDPEYMGSITIDPVLLEATGMAVNEKVLIADCTNGNRFESYIFQGDRGSGEIRVNGAAAKLTAVGHRVLIMSFAQMTAQEMKSHRPKVVICDAHNGIAELVEYSPAEAAAADLSR
ncbi:MAG: aspartate 1-decarboxylase [Planctomycetota bacterium]|nr:aspartate 1-decarboxylase [Planctomycetota bacterium]